MKTFIKGISTQFARCLRTGAGVGFGACLLNTGLNFALHDSFPYPAGYAGIQLNTGMATTHQETAAVTRTPAGLVQDGYRTPPLLVSDLLEKRPADNDIVTPRYTTNGISETTTINARTLGKFAAYGDSLQTAQGMTPHARLFLYEDRQSICGISLNSANACTDQKDIYFGLSMLEHLNLQEAEALYGHELAHARCQTAISKEGMSSVDIEAQADQLGLRMTGKTRSFTTTLLKIAKMHDFQPMDYYRDQILEMTGQATHPGTLDRVNAVRQHKSP